MIYLRSNRTRVSHLQGKSPSLCTISLAPWLDTLSPARKAPSSIPWCQEPAGLVLGSTYLLPPELRCQKVLVAPPQKAPQCQLLSHPLLGMGAGKGGSDSALCPPLPTPLPRLSLSPGSAGPGPGATVWTHRPCGGQWDMRPAGHGLHGGKPGGTCRGTCQCRCLQGKGFRCRDEDRAPHQGHEHQGSLRQGWGRQQQQWQQKQERRGRGSPEP